jgi:glycosyltransferase involved in cell wall biosynthesis
MQKKLLRVTTISLSLDKLLKGQLKYLNQYYDVVGVASDIGSLEQVGLREGIRVVNLPMERDISFINDFLSLMKMIRLIIKEKPYIVHSNTPKASLIAMIAAWICRVPHRIYTVTGLRFETTEGSFKRLLIMMEKIACACATKVIPEGDGVAATLRREKITNKPLKKILNGSINGIDTSFFDPLCYDLETKQNLRKQLDIDGNDFVFIFIGRLVKDKGINELVAAFKKLTQVTHLENYQISNIKLLLVGPLEEKLDPILPKTLQEITTNKDIITVGYQDDVRAYLAISDTLVFPSYREGFPNVVMQAGAMGLPSIVTNITGCNEIIIEGENGIIIPAKSDNAILEAMQFFLENPGKMKQMAGNSRPMIENRYEQKKVWQTQLEEYRKLEKR